MSVSFPDDLHVGLIVCLSKDWLAAQPIRVVGWCPAFFMWEDEFRRVFWIRAQIVLVSHCVDLCNGDLVTLVIW